MARTIEHHHCPTATVTSRALLAPDAFIRRITELSAAGAAAALSFALAQGAQAAPPGTFQGEMQALYNHICTTASGSADCNGAGPASGGQAGVQNDNLAQNIIEQRMHELQCGPDGNAGAECGGHTGGASEDSTSYEGLSVYVSSNYENKDHDNTDFETGFDSNKGGLTMGLDGRIGTTAIIGGAVDYGHTWGNFDHDGGDFSLDSVGALFYGSYFPSDQSFIDAVVGGAAKSYELNRQFTRLVPGGPAITPSKGDTDGFEFTSSLAGGYDFTFDALTIGPRAGLYYKRTEFNSFSEKGGVLALRYEDEVEDSLTTRIGGQATYAISTSFGVIVPQVTAEYVHEFLNGQQAIHAQSVLDPTPAGAVSYLTNPPDRNYAEIGAGVVFVLPNGVSPYINYQAEIANQFDQIQTVTVGVRLEL
jgi:outer membrane autotransporter protein